MLFAAKKPDIFQRLIHWSTHSRFNHAAIVIDTVPYEMGVSAGTFIAEATAAGVQRNSLYLKDQSELTFVSVPYDDEDDRLTAVAWATARVGVRYGYLNAVMCGLNNFLVGFNLSIKMTDSIICSELVAESLERAGFDFGKDSSEVSPGDLATAFGVAR